MFYDRMTMKNHKSLHIPVVTNAFVLKKYTQFHFTFRMKDYMI